MKKPALLLLWILCLLGLMTSAALAAPEDAARIGSTDYATLAAAFNAAGDGDTVKLLADAALTETINVTKKVTLDLNGYDVTNAAAAPFTVNGGAFTVTDNSANKDGCITASNTSGGNDDKAAILLKSGSFVLESGKINGSKYGVRAVSGTVPITIKGGTITAKSYGVIHYYGDFEMTGGSITSEGYGLAAYGDVTVSGGSIHGNTVGYTAGGNVDTTKAVFSSTAKVTGGVFGILWPSGGSLTLESDVEITGQTAVYVKSGTLKITGGTIRGTGDATPYAYRDSGANPTGDALVIENVGANGYEAVTSVSIEGGNFVSAKAASVASYAAKTQNSSIEAVKEFITGGTFDDEAYKQYLPAGSYEVSVVPSDNGSVTAAPMAAIKDQVVTLTVTPDKGYELKTLSVKQGDGEGQTDVQVTNGTFIMPASNVTVTATFTAVDYTITIDGPITNGTVTADKATANYGQKVTLTVTPHEGYELESLKAVYGAEGVLTIAADNTFTMPADNVRVTAAFKAKSVEPVPPQITAPEAAQTVEVMEGNKATLKVTATNADGYQWYIDRRDGKGYEAIQGANKASYTTGPVEKDNDGYTYFCQVWNDDGEAESPVFTLKVTAKPDIPKTGDEANLLLWALCLLGGAVLLTALKGRVFCRK